MYGYNAEQPIAIPITQYGSTVYIGIAMGGPALYTFTKTYRIFALQ